MEAQTFAIPDCCTVDFDKRIEKLRRKADRIGTRLPYWKTLAFEMRPIRAPEYPGEPAEDIPQMRWRRVEICGIDDVRIAGCNLLARIEPSPVEGVNLIFGTPGREDEDFSDFRTASLRCDHCETKRARKRSYILEDPDSGTRHLIGRNCLATFLGSPNADSIADFSDSICRLLNSEMDEYLRESDSIRRDDLYLDLHRFLSLTAAIVERWGFISTSKAIADDLYSTKACAIDAWFGTGPFEEKPIGQIPRSVPEITAEHKAQARAAIEWIRTISSDPIITKNEYLLNLRLICEKNHVPLRKLGLIASLLTAHKRAEEKAKARSEREEKLAKAEPLPNCDKRIQIEGSIVSAQWRENDFGSTLKITVEHPAGWRVWGSAPGSFGDDSQALIGSTVRFMARVSPSDSDKSFGFFSRPTKGEITQAAPAATEEATA